VVLCLGAWGLRLIYLYEHRNSPFFDAPIVDARVFFERAQQIAAGDYWAGAEPFWQPPLYIYFLALVHWLFPDRFFVVIRLIQSLLGSLTCLLVYTIARKAVPVVTARTAAIVAALYSVFFYFEGELLAVSVEIFLYLLVLHRLLVALQARRAREWGLAGLFGGLAVLTRPNFLLFIGAFLIWLIFLERRQNPDRWGWNLLKRWAQILIPTFMLILPVTLRNYVIGGDFVFISANSGINFYIGNNPDYDRTVDIHPGMQWNEMVMEPVHVGLTKASERSAFFTAKGIDYILTRPLDYAALLVKKLWLFWSGPEIKRNQNIYYARKHSLLLRSLLWDRIIAFPFGLIAPLSLLGLALSWRHRTSSLSLLCLYSFSYMASVLLFFVTSRYRLPVLPVLLIFAASALTALWHSLSNRQNKRLAGLAISFLGLLVLLNLRSAPDLDLDAQLHFDLGEVHLRKERYDKAVEHSLLALALEPTYNYARHNLTVAYFHQQRYEEAIREGLRVIAENPRRPNTHIVLGRCFTAVGQPQRAVRHFQRALEIDPESGMAHYYFGHLLNKQGNFPEAIEHLSSARNWRPDDFWICYELGRTYQGSDQLDSALRFFIKANQLEKRPEALNAIGAIHILRNDLVRARSHFEQTLDLDPAYLEAQVNIGLVDLERGLFEEAIDRLQRALQMYPRSILAHRALIETYTRAEKRDKAATLQKRLDQLTQ